MVGYVIFLNIITILPSLVYLKNMYVVAIY